MSDEPSKEFPSIPVKESTPRQPENPWLEGLKTVGLSVVLAIGIRTFVAEARYIPSGSMLPTLQINNRLIVDKLGYRFREPQRGEIVVFNPTKELEEQKFHDAFIKRVIGLPGDKIEVKEGQVFVNGNSIKEPYLGQSKKIKVLWSLHLYENYHFNISVKTSSNVLLRLVKASGIFQFLVLRGSILFEIAR